MGQSFTPSSLTLESGHTTPPSLLCEADLITLMDTKGIGTDATIAQHIKTILDRKYVTTTDQIGRGKEGGRGGGAAAGGRGGRGAAAGRGGGGREGGGGGGGERRFTPTDLGLALVEGYEEIGYDMTRPFLRAEMEKECKKVARGEVSREEMVRRCLETMKVCFERCEEEGGSLLEAVGRYFRRRGEGGREGWLLSHGHSRFGQRPH